MFSHMGRLAKDYLRFFINKNKNNILIKFYIKQEDLKIARNFANF